MTIRMLLHGGVIGSPLPQSSAEDVRSYIRDLLGWMETSKDGQVSVCISERTSASLFADGLYPLRPTIKQVLAYHGIEEYDANTVGLIVDYLLASLPEFESLYKIDDCLADNLILAPDLHDPARPNVSDDVRRCILMVMMVERFCSANVDDIILSGSSAQSISQISVSGEVLAIDTHRSDVTIELPAVINGLVRVAADGKGVMAVVDAGRLVVLAESESDVMLAINCALAKAGLDAPRAFVFGTTFFSSLTAAKTVPLATRTLRALVDTILRSHLEKTHHLRVDAGANASQVMRGGDAAWRRDIDNELHLHYWERVDGSVEFASIVRHNNFKIPG